jgi:hypothetical protein
MVQIHTSEDRIYLYHLKNLLEDQGIDCLIKNDQLSSLVGELPAGEAWPELWIADKLKEKWAKEIILDHEKSIATGSNWVCENCGEEHSPQFKDCWNCQSTKAF